MSRSSRRASESPTGSLLREAAKTSFSQADTVDSLFDSAALEQLVLVAHLKADTPCREQVL
jgi:hypothetical protein